VRSGDVIFHPRALDEVADAANYYEAERPGMGIELREKIRATAARIVAFPHAAPMWRDEPNHRIARVGRFPYRLPYKVKRDSIRILALAHLRRRSGYWLERFHSD
jgi:plasmid stabilization system protein ParE